MLVATFGEGTEWAGKTITYSDGVFTVEDDGELAADEVMRRGRQGELEWASEAMPFWVAALAHTSPPPEKHKTPPWVWVVVAVAAVAMIAVVAGVAFFMRDAMHDEAPPSASGSPAATRTPAPTQPATAGASQGKGAWVPVLTWSGGGRGTIVSRSDTFEITGSRQRVGTFWDRVGAKPSTPPPQWRVVSAHDGSVVETVVATIPRQLTPFRVQPGTYYLAATATDCIWRAIVEDLE